MPRAKRKKTPHHTTVTRSYRFPLEPNHTQAERLRSAVRLAGEAQNLLAEDRARNREEQRQVREAGGSPAYLTKADQYKRLSALQKSYRRFSRLHSQVLQVAANRIDEATKRWFEARRSGRHHVRPPRPRPVEKYNSITYPQYGSSAHLKKGVLHLSKLGDFKIRDYRRLRGQPKTVTVKWSEGRWWAILTCELQAKDACASLEEVSGRPDTGIDPGLESLATTAHGVIFDPPKALKERLSALRSAQRNMSRKFEARKKAYAVEAARRKAAGEPELPPLRALPYSSRLKAQIKCVAKLHTKAKRVREHHHKVFARRLERAHARIGVEDHSVQFMLRNRRQARAAADRALHAFKGHLKSALGEARYFPTASSRPGIGGNSQTCLCGASVPKTLKDRIHECPACGLTAPRDVVSANIVMLIAFGSTALSIPAAGQAVVRRGGTQAGAASAASSERCGASEVSVKRQPPLPRARSTGGAQATPAVKTTVHRTRRKPQSLPVATSR
jgi:putative transposase